MGMGWHHPTKQAIGFEAITVSTIAVGLTKVSYQPADAAEIMVENGPIRFRRDGVVATSSTGHLLRDGDVLYIDNPSDMINLSMIRDANKDGDITITYYGH